MTRGRRAYAALAWTGLLLACTEDLTAPGRCPDFCPPGGISVVDTLLSTVVERDSAFRGYLTPPPSPVLLASNIPGVRDSRPIMQFQPLGTTTRLGNDTTSYPILGTDSAQLTLTIARRDTNAGNLRVNLYRLPRAIDSNTTFADLTGPFTDSLLKSVNVDSVIELPSGVDTATGDRVIVDSTSVFVIMHLDSAAARFVVADSGQLTYGVRIQADNPTSLVIGSNESVSAPVIVWFIGVDSAGTTAHSTRTVAPQFDSYVFDPPAAPIDSTLAVGGMPSARSLLRFAMPRDLRDSTQIVRATLILVPAVAAQGAPTDTFRLIAHAVVTDIGAKSPLITAPPGSVDSTFLGVAPVPINSTDTVFVEITRILRRWALDTLAANALILRSGGEGVVLSEIRFHSSRHATLRPSVRLTYTPRYPFGVP